MSTELKESRDVQTTRNRFSRRGGSFSTKDDRPRQPRVDSAPSQKQIHSNSRGRAKNSNGAPQNRSRRGRGPKHRPRGDLEKRDDRILDGGWSELPAELLVLILEQLPIADRIASIRVCNGWHYAAKSNLLWSDACLTRWDHCDLSAYDHDWWMVWKTKNRRSRTRKITLDVDRSELFVSTPGLRKIYAVGPYGHFRLDLSLVTLKFLQWPNAQEALTAILTSFDHPRFAKTGKYGPTSGWDDRDDACLLWLASVNSTFYGPRGKVVRSVKTPSKIFCNMFDAANVDRASWPGQLVEDTTIRNISKDRVDSSLWLWHKVRIEIDVEILFGDGRLLIPATEEWQNLYASVMEKLYNNRQKTALDQVNHSLIQKYIRPLEQPSERLNLQRGVGALESLTSKTGLMFQYKHC